MIDNSLQKQIDDLQKEIDKRFESLSYKPMGGDQGPLGGSRKAEKYNQIERPIQDELDRIDSELYDTSIATDDIGVRIPFGRIMPGGGGLDFTIVSLGYKCDPDSDNPDEVRIYAGTIDRIAVAQTDITVVNNDYVYIRRTRANDTMLVTAAASVPANDATYVYYRLYRFTVTAGAASIQNIYRFCDIEGEIPVRWK